MTYCKNVWLIDDEEISSYFTAGIIKINEFSSEVRSFTNATEALEALEACVDTRGFPDFIFLDLNMPGLDGWGFLQVYRNFPKEVKESCTLYILSSSIDEEDINKSKLYEDVRDFLIKPFDKKYLEVVKFQTTTVLSYPK
jgi:CheY-like chemotaxis protein